MGSFVANVLYIHKTSRRNSRIQNWMQWQYGSIYIRRCTARKRRSLFLDELVMLVIVLGLVLVVMLVIVLTIMLVRVIVLVFVLMLVRVLAFVLVYMFVLWLYLCLCI